MNIPENPYRKAMANIYMERYMGTVLEDEIKKFVNGDDEPSLDYYIAAERFISRSIKLLMKFNTKESNEDCMMLTMMATYVSFEIERLLALKDKN